MKPPLARRAGDGLVTATMDGHIEETETKFCSLGGADNPFVMESGDTLVDAVVAYEAYGQLNTKGSNAILLFHALSGSQHAAGHTATVDGVGDRWTADCRTGWWSDFIGPGKALDTDRYFVICANYLGGCYGSTGPTSIDPATGAP